MPNKGGPECEALMDKINTLIGDLNIYDWFGPWEVKEDGSKPLTIEERTRTVMVDG